MNEKEPLLGELPEGALTPQEAGDQEKEGLSPRHQRVAALLTRLAATARSFLLYDPQNEAIQRFLALLLDGFVSTLAEEGALTLTVLPMELVFEGHSVYLNRDRERSLAFRLHRDGVRELRFRPGFDWEELARLLEILSIRYTGIHQHEDDIVTLLWKAAFRHLDFVAVEGIVPDDDEPGAAAAAPAPALPGCGPSPTLPDDVDLPRPSLPPPVGPSWGDLPSDALDRLRSEASPSHLPADCLALLAAIRLCIGEASLGMRFGEVAHVFGEIRDFLLGESHLAPLKGFVALLWKMAGDVEPAWDEGRHAALYELLESCGDRRALRRLLRGIPPDSLKLDPELVEVLDRACPDPLPAVLDVLPEEGGAAGRAIVRQLLEHYGARKLDVLQSRFEHSTGHVASDLLRVMAHIAGEDAATFIAAQASHKDGAVVDEALWHLEHMPYSGTVGRAFFDAFRWTDANRRSRVLTMIALTQDRRFVDLLAGHVEEQGERLPLGEAARIGQVLGELAGPGSVGRWAAWLEPAGRFRKGLQGPLSRQVVAALALSEVPGAEAGEVLARALDSAEREAQQWILGALGQRERKFGETV